MSEHLAHDRRAGPARRPAADRRGSPRGHGRYSPIPPAPSLPRPELAVLRDHAGPLGLLFWQCISDVLLWCAATERAGLFRPRGPAHAEALAYTLRDVTELTEPVSELLQVSAMPELAVPARVADACEQVMRWAEQHGMKETAAQFAEAAARLEPEVSSRCYTAGRTCRHVGDAGRAAMWFRRAERLARRAGSQIDFAIAHLGYGNLLLDQGRVEEAEDHFGKAIRAALRAGRKSLAASAYHDLLASSVGRGALDAAEEYARLALDLYPHKHPRIPALAHDAAVVLMRRGYYSSALPLLEKAAEWIAVPAERMIVLASLARAAAAVRDNIRFQRSSAAALRIAAIDRPRAAAALYHIAQGARCFQDVDRARDLARHALESAREWGNEAVTVIAERLLKDLSNGAPPDVDTVPAEGGPVDRLVADLLKRLNKVSPAGKAAPLPEDFPV